MFPAARKGDPVTHDMLVPSGVIGPPVTGPCPPPTGPVMIEGLPAAHVNCTVVCSGATSAGPAHPPPPGPPPPIVLGSPTVQIHSQMAARWVPSGDIGACGVFLGDPKLTPARTVIIGGPAAVAAVAAGTVTMTVGGMVVNGSPEDVAAWMGIVAREMGNSEAFEIEALAMINDTAHPVRFNVGRNNAFFVDSFANNNVDLNDLAWFDRDPNPQYPWAPTQGELVTHFVVERRERAVNGSGFPAAHAAPIAPGGAQEQYRQDRSQPGRIVSQVSSANPTTPGDTDATFSDDSGNQYVVTLDPANQPVQRQYTPAAPTPAAPGMSSVTPPP